MRKSRTNQWGHTERTTSEIYKKVERELKVGEGKPAADTGTTVRAKGKKFNPNYPPCVIKKSRSGKNYFCNISRYPMSVKKVPGSRNKEIRTFVRGNLLNQFNYFLVENSSFRVSFEISPDGKIKTETIMYSASGSDRDWRPIEGSENLEPILYTILNGE